MAYPGTLDTFTTKQDGIDDILAAHMNAVQSAILAVETELGIGLHGSLADLATRLAVAHNNDGTLKPGAFTPASASITHAMLAVNAVQNDVILAGTITGASIAAATISGSNLQNATVGTTQLAALAITTALLADLAVTTAKIASPGVFPDNLGLLVWNATGSTLTAGQLVYVSGWNAANGLAQVSLAANNAAQQWAVYIVPASISNGASGLVRCHWTSGVNLNTGGSTVGNPVYMDSTAGGWTLVVPTSTASRQRIVGHVRVVDAAAGQVEFDTFSHLGAVLGTQDLPAGTCLNSIDNAFSTIQTITPTANRCLTLNHRNGVGATVFLASNNATDATWRTLINFGSKYQFGTDSGFNGTSDWFVQNQSTGNFVLQASAADLVTVGSAAAGGGAVLGKSGGKIAAFDGTPVIQQANASQADVTAITDTHAKAAVQAIYNLLKNYNLAPATA